jgi:hypothetical protein
MKADRSTTLCDFKCPKHEKCAMYCEGFDKSKTFHWGKEPYNYRTNSCQGFAPIDEDYVIKKVVNFLKPKWQ